MSLSSNKDTAQMFSSCARNNGNYERDEFEFKHGTYKSATQFNQVDAYLGSSKRKEKRNFVNSSVSAQSYLRYVLSKLEIVNSAIN